MSLSLRLAWALHDNILQPPSLWEYLFSNLMISLPPSKSCVLLRVFWRSSGCINSINGFEYNSVTDHPRVIVHAGFRTLNIPSKFPTQSISVDSSKKLRSALGSILPFLQRSI